MTEELNKVLLGKQLMIKNALYLSANDYIKPFVDRMAPFTNEFKCQVKTPDQVSITDNEPDLVYTKVNVQAILPTDSSLSTRKVVGMTYGLDLKKPVVKFYTGVLDTEHDNFITFDKDALIIQEIEPETPFNYTCIQSLIERTDNTKVMLSQLSQNFIYKDNFAAQVGYWIDSTLDNIIVNQSGKIKIATSLPIDAYKNLVKNLDSEFYVNDPDKITYYEIYMALLGVIRDDDKDIVNKFEKTLLINKMLRL